MVKDGWYHCPACGKRLLKTPPDSVLYGLPVWCRRCKVDWFPTIFNGWELGEDEPFPLSDTDK
jgi:hypothetical protein